MAVTTGAALLQEMLDALADDAELRQRMRDLVGAGTGAPASTAPDFVDRRGAALGPAEWRQLTRAVPSFKVGRRLLVRRADLAAWIEAHRVRRDVEPAPLPTDEPDPFQRLIEAGRLRVVRGNEGQK